jgi:hypothetical protein
LREHFPEAELRRNVERAAENIQRLAKRYQGNKAAARAGAERLLAEESTAHDPDLRSAALSRAQDESSAAQQDLGARNSEVDEATNDLKANTPADRPRHTPDLPDEPVDRPDALRRAADAAEEAASRQAEVGRRERERDAEETKSQRWTTRAGMLADQADKLSAVGPADVALGDVSSDDDQVRRDVKALTGRLAAVDSTFQTAMSLRSRCADALRNWALQDRFARIADDEHGMAVRQMRDLLRAEDLVERVAPRAADVASDLATREKGDCTADRAGGDPWSHGRPAYRCQHGHTSARPSGSSRMRNTYVREDLIVVAIRGLLREEDPELEGRPVWMIARHLREQGLMVTARLVELGELVEAATATTWLIWSGRSEDPNTAEHALTSAEFDVQHLLPDTMAASLPTPHRGAIAPPPQWPAAPLAAADFTTFRAACRRQLGRCAPTDVASCRVQQRRSSGVTAAASWPRRSR